MPLAILLHRESPTTKSLKAIVEKAHRLKTINLDYDIDLRFSQLTLTPIANVAITGKCNNGVIQQPALTQHTNIKPVCPDEGFESDVDSVSLISNDETFGLNITESVLPLKSPETDSANGSACSDSDDTESGCNKSKLSTLSNMIGVKGTFSSNTTPNSSPKLNKSNDFHESNRHLAINSKRSPIRLPILSETFNLVDCLCYTDLKYPDTLLFVIRNDVLVFKFEKLLQLESFHSNFSALKAVANNQKINLGAGRPIPEQPKFNLLHRTDANGVTHIEISRQGGDFSSNIQADYEPSSIISINTPDTYIHNTARTYALKKSLSSENLLDKLLAQSNVLENCSSDLKKIWSSAENILDSPKRPERRKKIKAPAPPPPTNQNILRGQFVRVNVSKEDQKPLSSESKSIVPFSVKPLKDIPYPKDVKPVKEVMIPKKPACWANSMPRLLRKQRSRSETRVFTPMAYRYIDTTLPNIEPSNNYVTFFKANPYKTVSTAHRISERLFGMSSKLKEFGSLQSECNLNDKYGRSDDPRYSSLGNLSYKISNLDGSLKSVIKKDDNKRKNEKKVTFSAYNTVQVV